MREQPDPDGPGAAREPHQPWKQEGFSGEENPRQVETHNINRSAESVTDKLLDRLFELRKQKYPDQKSIEEVRGLLENEAVLREAWEASGSKEVGSGQLEVDPTLDEEEQKDRAARQIAQLLQNIDGLDKDVQDLAIQAIVDIEEYPPNIQKILDESFQAFLGSVELVSDYLKVETHEDADDKVDYCLYQLTHEGYRDTLSMNDYQEMFRRLTIAQRDLTDFHVAMLRATVTRKHPSP